MIEEIAHYLEDTKGEKSSKRLGYVVALFNFLLLCDVALFTFLIKGKGELALELLIYLGGAVLVMGGFVVTEVFKRKKHE